MARRYGWASTFPVLRDATVAEVRGSLAEFLREVDEGQIRAWDSDIPQLQREVTEIMVREPAASAYHAVLEYELPFETRRSDVVLLASGLVMVIELKGKDRASQADIDQAAAYARDLRCYHRACHETPVIALVVPTRATGLLEERDGVIVAGPDAVDALVAKFDRPRLAEALKASEFLDEEAYQPLPTIVRAARELFRSEGKLPYIRRARAATDPTLKLISDIVHDAARTRTRRFVIVTGVPGSGKTLVGLQLVHSHFLDDLAVERPGSRPTAPAVFLSGNDPLVSVLQYQLKEAGGGGKTFVRRVKQYIQRFASSDQVPTEHVLVFDEAQRAWDAKKMGKEHPDAAAMSEPEHFIELGSRVPEWCVVVALVGTGQEIHEGEESGVAEWRRAVEGTPASGWSVHIPPGTAPQFSGSNVPWTTSSELNLETELRFHAANDLHEFVARLLADEPLDGVQAIAAQLRAASYHLRITRDLADARAYLRERYAGAPDARYGLLASSRDRDLPHFGVDNEFKAQRRVSGRIGAWFTDPESAPGKHSCRYLRSCATEFHAQGLELDGVLLAWGTDYVWSGSAWSNAGARAYRQSLVRDSKMLRRNAYRVLLTRARDVTVVFVPELPELDATAARLRAAGFAAV